MSDNQGKQGQNSAKGLEGIVNFNGENYRLGTLIKRGLVVECERYYPVKISSPSEGKYYKSHDGKRYERATKYDFLITYPLWKSPRLVPKLKIIRGIRGGMYQRQNGEWYYTNGRKFYDFIVNEKTYGRKFGIDGEVRRIGIDDSVIGVFYCSKGLYIEDLDPATRVYYDA